MNFGILMIQGLVNSFGTTIMAAFSVAVKIDTIAYMPVQDFGNAFPFFVAQNYGAKKYARIRKGFLLALVSVLIFCLVISAVVFGFADSLMGFFANEGSAVSAAGAEYLRVEGAFYVGIGILFLLYGYYRRSGQAGCLGGSYHNLTGTKSNSCLCTHRPFPNRRDRNLGGDTNRVGTR